MNGPAGDIGAGDQALSACWNEDLDLYLDGELPSFREADLFRHLSVCVECREHLNGVLAFRRVLRDEFVDVPPWADDRLLARIEEQRRVSERTSRLHARDSLWTARATVSVRSLVLAFGIFVVSLAVLASLKDGARGYVYFEQESVRFDEASRLGSEVYVFYPGLTIEAEREAF
jgi:anti-sigma factor RsiW